ncbi:hypothetical protein T11_171 [Trichinella zimbabwensis]|uniref:Uncharacterized protein n=1 Tax=Trichinella zimbabwensis TaxID=268475 RepID=A0A0V1I2K5_9BILA|nr:hypothetical protein T11_171 [Trichinella zimbabwensis]
MSLDHHSISRVNHFDDRENPRPNLTIDEGLIAL